MFGLTREAVKGRWLKRLKEELKNVGLHYTKW
jgi:hypothetical protein